MDGRTLDSAKKAGIDVVEALRRHNTTPALLKLNSGVVASPNISLIDLTVAIITGQASKLNR